jgi:CDP-diacylglycerol--glycerol-3-phosphate 3-phosphatidyltransferase
VGEFGTSPSVWTFPQTSTSPPSANLSQSYFTDRQDRYIHFKSQPALAQYCFSFLQTVSGFSYKLSAAGENGSDYSLHWPDPTTHPEKIQSKAEKNLSDFQASHVSSFSVEGKEQVASDDKEDQVLLFPIIQAGQFNIREEERALSLLFDHLGPRKKFPLSNSLLDLTSGYFGLYQKYQDLILQSPVCCRVVAASPKVPYSEDSDAHY